MTSLARNNMGFIVPEFLTAVPVGLAAVGGALYAAPYPLMYRIPLALVIGLGVTMGLNAGLDATGVLRPTAAEAAAKVKSQEEFKAILAEAKEIPKEEYLVKMQEHADQNKKLREAQYLRGRIIMGAGVMGVIAFSYWFKKQVI